MDFLEKIFSNTNQQPKEDKSFSNLIKRALNGNSSEINPAFLYEINSYCQTKENSHKVMHALSNAIDENCESPILVFKALKLILLLSKLSAQTFTPAAKNYAPEIQTIIHVSFDKPGLPHVNTIHKYANVLYLHLVKNIPLPEMKIPPRPKQQPTHNHNQNQRQPQRGGHTRLDEEGGSLFDSNDNFEDKNNDNKKTEDSGSFLSNLMDLGPRRRPPQQQQTQQQQAPRGSNSQNQEGPRLPAVFASGGAFQGVRSRISQPLDYGYEDDNEGGESLLNFDNNNQNNGGNDDLLIGAFDDIETSNDKIQASTNNKSNSIDQTEFVFSGAEPATSNSQTTDLNTPFNPFGSNGFNPTFPDTNDFKNSDEINKPTNTYRRPFVASGPKPKFDPSKMKKKPKVVPNTVPQDNFDPFGTGSASNAFDNIPKEPQKKQSLMERFGQMPQKSQSQEEKPKQPQNPGQNIFDLLGDDVFGDEEPEPSNTASEPAIQPQKETQKGSTNVSDALGGDDFGSFENVQTNEKQKVTSNEELFESFGSSPQLSQELDKKNGSANVFDVLGDDAFGETQEQQKLQPQQTNSKEGLFEPFNSQPQQEQAPKQKNSSANVFDILGDDVFTAPSNLSAVKSTEDHLEHPKDDMFEPFGSTNVQSEQKQQQTNSKNDLFEPFESTTVQPEQNQQQTSSKNDLFEPFGSTTAQQEQKQQQTSSRDDLFEPFGSSKQQQQPQKSSGNVFDMLDDNEFEGTQPSKSSQLATNISASNDLFEPIDAAPTSSPPSPQIQPQKPQQPQQQKNSSTNVFDMLGDDDFTSPQSNISQVQASSKDDLFEPFGSTSGQLEKKQQQTSSKNDLFEPFGSATAQPELKKQQTSSKDDLFEPFGSSTQQQQPQKSSGNVFDMLDDNEFEGTQPSKSSQLATNISASNDLFEPIDAAPTSSPPSPQIQPQKPQQPQQQKNSSTNVFDMLGDDMFSSNPAPASQPMASNGGNASNDLFESFGSAPLSSPQASQSPSQQKNSSANVFDMLGDDMFSSNPTPSSQPAQPAGSKGGDANDLFNSFPSVQPAAVPNNASSNFDDFFSSPSQPQQKQQPKLDMFESLGKPPQQKNNQPSSANLFDMLDSSEIHTSQPPNRTSKSNDLHDLFGS